MKMPRYVLKIGPLDFVIADKKGIGMLAELLADAVVVETDLHHNPPEITLRYDEEPHMVEFLKRVECVPIPGNTVWKRKPEKGEVEIIRPVEKPPKALKAPPRKALPAPQRKALPPPSPQLALL